MTFEEFLQKHNGKYLEVAGSANAQNQCVDLVNGYIRDVLGLSIIEWTNAKDFPSKVGNEFDWIKNTPNGVPQYGDIIIWGNGDYGHIAVFIEGDVNRFKSFDQNYPVGSPCHVQGHTYANVTGWLHYNVIMKEEPMEMNDQTIIDLGRFGKMEIQRIRGEMAEFEKVRGEYEALKKVHETVKEDFTIEVEACKASAKSWKESHDKFLAEVAGILGTTQDKEVIKVELQRLIKVENKLKSIEDDRPISGPNWIQSFILAMKALFTKLDKEVNKQ